MSVIFHLFCAEDLKQLTLAQLEELRDIIRQEVENSQDPTLEVSLAISRLIQDKYMQKLLLSTSSMPAATYSPPRAVYISQENAIEISQRAIDTLRKRVYEVFYQLTSQLPSGPSSPLDSPKLTTDELLDQLLSPADYEKLAATAGPTGGVILAWALTYELANFKSYEALERVKQRAEEAFIRLTGLRPKGPDSPSSPFYPLFRLTEDDVLGALRREGGELSLAELTDVTHFSSPVVESVVQQLAEKQVVQVHEDAGTGLKLIQLRESRTPWQAIGQWLRNE
jgi:hypothetical protein